MTPPPPPSADRLTSPAHDPTPSSSNPNKNHARSRMDPQQPRPLRDSFDSGYPRSSGDDKSSTGTVDQLDLEEEDDDDEEDETQQQHPGRLTDPVGERQQRTPADGQEDPPPAIGKT